MRNNRFGIALMVLWSLAVGVVPASAQSIRTARAPITKEPERFAFIVGNARYQRANSNLDDLVDACPEAVQFRNNLLSVGWKADHIYPLVKAPAPGETADDAVQAAICDKTNSALQRQLTTFMNLLLGNENNPYGVIYYAGHGAQSNDEFYAFGVDSNVDLRKEVELLRTYTNYEVFSQPSFPGADGETAVNLTRLAARVNGPQGKALLVIVDACRDDPVLDQFTSSRTDPGPRNAEERRRVSIGYINSRPDKYDALFRNIMIMFAGRPGQPVPSGTAKMSNWFSQHLFDYLQKSANLQAPIPLFVSNFESQAKGAQGGLPDFARQIPQHVGSMASSPVFCFKGCAQPLSVWTNEKAEVIGEAATAAPRRAERMPSVKPRDPDQAGPRRIQVGFSIPASMLLPASSGLRADATARSPQQPARPLNLDVFYCSGDAGEAEQKRTAREFAEATRRLAPRDYILAGTYINQIRLRSLDVNVNLAMVHPKTGTSLVLVQSESASPAWLERLASDFDRTYMDDVTKGYIRAYFCTGFSVKQKPHPLVYTQVSHRYQVPQAKQYLSLLSTALPNLKFVDGIEAVDDTHPDKTHTPDVTQVRYYTSEQTDQAEELAKLLQQQVSKPVVVVKMRALEPTARKNPVIELWFGRNETASWAPPPVQD